MAVTRGFQGRTFDVPQTGVPCIDLPSRAPCVAADAGFPLITPGSSLHRELQLLVESGLTPYQAVRAATVVPASFLGKDGEFGTIAIGKRADLLLVEDNPLENIGHLRTPVGVMARGKWISRSQLEQMLDALRPGMLPPNLSGR